MCGIAGFIDHAIPAAEAELRLRSMLARITHRGPDGEGEFVGSGAALGMRRLSIIDLEGGWQPIWNEDRSIAVVFNGEIYNYVELRRTLSGHTFRTDSDTEVLVHLYEEAGENLFLRLRGMFAFALLDLRARIVLIGRDHFGQKPLYYHAGKGTFAFASELKSLLALSHIRRDIEEDAYLDYATWLSLPAPRTHFRDIKKLPAGCAVKVPLENPGEFKVSRYWQYDLSEQASIDAFEPAVELLDRTLHESLQIHLRADVPVGVLLSSGLDSRCVAAYAQEIQQGALSTFSVGFADEESELSGAAETAREIQSHHHAIELGAADLSSHIGRVAWHLDEPVGDPAAFAVLKVCELARDHVKVLLSGEGADEIFAGYAERYAGMLRTMERSDLFRRFAPLLPRMNSGEASSRFSRMTARAHMSAAAEAVMLRQEGLPGDVRFPRGLTGSQRRRLSERRAEIGAQLFRPQRDRLSELLVMDLEWQLAESLLQKADKMSMAASIELRTPLLDIEVAALAARMDSWLKLPPGGPGKMVLRRCLARRIPEVATRPKKGFPVPLRQWFTGPLRDEMESTLFAQNSRALHHLDSRLLRDAWDDFLDGKWEGARLFYALWLYEIWFRSVVRA
jgi:asparagine synthase (glutamine-hydrolysing)